FRSRFIHFEIIGLNKPYRLGLCNKAALNQGYAFIRLEVFNKNPSRFFYEKMGAKLTGEAELPEFGLGIIELFYEWQL
ncbi:hypothetical protein ABTG05_12900, partial [Acinetobacter baumannii]